MNATKVTGSGSIVDWWDFRFLPYVSIKPTNKISPASSQKIRIRLPGMYFIQE